MLDPIRFEVLQLDQVVVEQPSKEWERRLREPTLVEGHKEEDVAVERRQRILMARYEPLLCFSSLADKPTLHKALQPHLGHLRAEPLCH